MRKTISSNNASLFSLKLACFLDKQKNHSIHRLFFIIFYFISKSIFSVNECLFFWSNFE